MKIRVVAGVAVAVVALGGCAQNPQDAAHVGSQTITVKDVDLMTQALCTEQATSSEASASAPSGVASVNDAAMAALIESAIDGQYAAANKLAYDRLSLAAQIAKLDPLIAKLPAGDQDATKALITSLFRGQLQVFQEVVRQLQLAGQQQPSQQVVQQAITAVEDSYAKKLKITLNPRFDTVGSGHGGDGSQSMSTSVSSFAKGGETANPAAAWVAALPASQKCG